MNNQTQNEVVLHTCGHVVLYTMPAAPAAVLNDRLQALRHMPCIDCQARGCHSGATPVADGTPVPPAAPVASPATRRRHARSRARNRYNFCRAAVTATAREAAALALLCLGALVLAGFCCIIGGY